MLLAPYNLLIITCGDSIRVHRSTDLVQIAQIDETNEFSLSGSRVTAVRLDSDMRIYYNTTKKDNTSKGTVGVLIVPTTANET